MIRTIAELLDGFRERELAALESHRGLGHGPIIGDMYEGLTRTLLDRALFEGLDLHVRDGFIRGPDGALSRGAVVGAASCTDEVFEAFVNPAACAAAGGVIFGAAGALLGALIGATMKTERWVSVPLDRLRVSLGPQRDGRFGFGASVRF